MRPDQLKYLTDDEHRAWDGCQSTSAYAFGTMAGAALPAALEALAEARAQDERERQRMATLLGMSTDNVPTWAALRVEVDAVLASEAGLRRERDEARAMLSDANEELALTARAIYGADADAHMLHESAAEVVRERDEARARLAKLGRAALTLLSALDVHEDATEGRELADGVYADAYHPDRADAVYEAKSALRAASVHTPGGDPAPRGAGGGS